MKTEFYLINFIHTMRSAHSKVMAIVTTILLSSLIGSAQIGNSLHFDGVDDRIDVVTSITGTFNAGSYTKEAWIRVDNPIGLNQNLISGEATALYIAPDGRLGGGNLVDVSDPTPLVANTWYHVALVYNHANNTVSLYKNGVLVASNSSVMFGPELFFHIGAYNFAFNFGGYMDEVRIWNVARTAQEINDNMNCAIHPSTPGLIAYFSFDEGTPNGNNSHLTNTRNYLDACAPVHGELVGFSLVGTTSNFSNVLPPSLTSYCVVNPEIQVVGSNFNCINNNDMIPSTADGTDYGIIVMSDITRFFTIRNHGNAPLTITSITSSDPSDFEVSASLPMVIPAFESNTFDVTFKATYLYGNKSATITIESDDADESTYQFAVQGNNAERGASLAFDGISSYITTPLDLNGSYTKEMWVYPHRNDILMNLFTGTGTAMYIDNGVLGGGNLTELSDPTGPLPINTWTHVALSFDAGTNTLKLYRNGVLVHTAAATGPGVDTDLQLGAFTSGYLFDGKMDEVRLWDVVRTDAEILASFECRIPVDASGLVAYYDFDQGTAGMSNTSVNVLKDRTCGRNDATLMNFMLNGVMANWVADNPGVIMSCEGMVPNIRVVGLDQCITNGDATPSVTDNTDFGLYSAPGNDHTFWVYNSGSSILIINAVNISGTHASAFSVMSISKTNILPGDSAAIVIRFASTLNGQKNGIVTIVTNDPNDSDFEFYVVGEGMGPVPVTLTNFNGRLQGKTVQLFWSTSQELNNAGFEVLRSDAHQQQWTRIGFIPAGNENGGDYTLTDYAPLPGVNTYRLKQLDVNGTYSYSHIIAFNLENNETSVVKFYPNPAKDNITLVVNDSKLLNTKARIVNSTGNSVAVFAINDYYQNVNISKLAPGVYIIHLSNGEKVRLMKH